MEMSFEMLLVSSSIGAFQSAFFGIYLFAVRKGRSIANLLLALLLIAFAIRIFKSVGYYFSNGHLIPNLLMNFGFGTNLAILPLLWLYLNAFINKEYRFSWHYDFIQLIPSVIVLLLSPFLTDYFWMNQYGYTISLLSMLAYLPFCFILIKKHQSRLTKIRRLWVISLTVGVTAVWCGYLGNFVFGIVPYIASPVLFSVVICFLSFLALREGSIFKLETKYESSTYTQVQIDACYARLQQLLTQSQPFRATGITLPKLAGQLAVTPNLLSETINKKTGFNLPDFINSYRVRDAKAMLENPEYDNQKIATIAFETGFNSLSVFNTAFKKFTSTTPSAFRKSLNKR
ncbi:helix-turn-helix domain-containing protein [Flavitalea sp.]